jgi:hypothetical protein
LRRRFHAPRPPTIGVLVHQHLDRVQHDRRFASQRPAFEIFKIGLRGQLTKYLRPVGFEQNLARPTPHLHDVCCVDCGRQLW